MFDPPTTDADDEWDRPLALGPQVKPENFDEVDLTAPLRAVELTEEQKAAAALITPGTKVLIVSGQNTAVDDLLPRLLPIWKDIGSTKITERELVILRLYSWESEGRDFVRRFAKVGRHIQRTDGDNAGGILMTLLNAFSDKAHEFDREGRKARSSNGSVVDKAVELYKADRNATESRKYDTLASLINQVQDRPEQIYQLGKSITRLVKDGPLTDAVAEADVVFGTPIGAADRTFRRVFRPHYITSDESPRDKETTSPVLFAHYSPRAYIFLGDHKQLKPVIFSKHQHRNYKPPKSFRKNIPEHPGGVEAAGDDYHGNDDGSKEAETEQGPADSKVTEEGWEQGEWQNKEATSGGWDQKKDTADKGEPEEAETKDASEKPKKDSLHPSTFANQVETSLIHRLMDAGEQPSYMLTQNWRQHGQVGEFFNQQFYDGKIKFHERNERFSQLDKAAVRWIQGLSGKDQIKGNTLMINKNSFENCEARSFSNVGNVNFVLLKVADLLADPSFSPTSKSDAKVMIIAPYDAQRNLYTHELQKRASWEMDSKGNWASFTSGSGATNGAQRSSVLSSSEELIDLLSDPQFSKSTKKGLDADVLIIAPYEAQRNLYEYELQRRASLELNSKGNWVRFDKSRIKIRTHQGAQGHEASVVIVDLTLSDAPGMTGHSQVVNVASSRSICAMLILINTRILQNVESKTRHLSGT